MSSMLPNLPTISELLESPPLKSLSQRVSRSIVLVRAKRFLDDMRTQVQSAAATVHIPAAAELAQRIAEWISREDQAVVVPAINATGDIWLACADHMPLAAEAIDRMSLVGSEYVAFSQPTVETTHGSQWEVERWLCRLTGAEAALATSTRGAALWLALHSIAAGREVIV